MDDPAREPKSLSVPISAEMLAAFAEYSGDWNPGHMDAAFARRSVAGARVVHGMLLALKAMDAIAAECGEFGIASIRASFRQPLVLDDAGNARAVVLMQPQATINHPQQLTFTVASDAGMHIEATIETKPATAWVSRIGDALISLSKAPSKLIADDHALAKLSKGNSAEVTTLIQSPARPFPSLAKCLAPQEIAALASISTLAGMKLPGKWCVLASFIVALKDLGDLNDEVLPAAKQASSIISHATIRRQSLAARMIVCDFSANLGGRDGATIAMGEYSAVVAAAPPMRTQSEVRRVIDSWGEEARHFREEFHGKNILVTGGSRGIGELVARALMELGADVWITHSGRDIPATTSLSDLEIPENRVLTWRIGQAFPPIDTPQSGLAFVVHCAAPRIRADSIEAERPGTLAFEAAAIRARDAYFTPIEDLVAATRDSLAPNVVVLGISSEYVLSRPPGFLHYANAKRDMEIWLAGLVDGGGGFGAANGGSARRVRGASIRLPQFASDQTRDAGGRSAGVDPLTLVKPILLALLGTPRMSGGAGF